MASCRRRAEGVSRCDKSFSPRNGRLSMRFTCTVRRLADGRWLARHSGSGVRAGFAVGTVEVTAASRHDALEKLQNELQYRIELCPCSGASTDRAELALREEG